MRNGGETSFVQTPVLADNGVITKQYLRGLEQAIKQRTPIAGANITIKITDGSFVISSTNSNDIFNASASGAGLNGFIEKTLTVCSNGTPATITVLALPEVVVTQPN